MSISTELNRLVAAVRANAEDPAVADRLADAVTAWHAPVRIQVTGRASVGRTAVVTALGLPPDVETAPLDSAYGRDPTLDGDVLIYVLPGSVGEADRDIVATLPPTRTLAVVNKADTIGDDIRSVCDAVERCHNSLAVPTVPMIADLAIRCRQGVPTEAETRALLRLSHCADPLLLASAELLLSAVLDVDVSMRRSLLLRWRRFGIDCAVTALRYDATLDATALGLLLRAASGVDAVTHALEVLIAHAAARRGVTLLDTLAMLAARAVNEPGAPTRTAIEKFLHGTAATQLVGSVDDTLDEPDILLCHAEFWRIRAGNAHLSADARREALYRHRNLLRTAIRVTGDEAGAL